MKGVFKKGMVVLKTASKGEVRVRFAPSPTGYLHVGGARTALFNWLFARNQGGKFILRIEDTDLARSTPESVQAILESLAWLGLDWDEGPGKEGKVGPYFQTQRLPLYAKYAQKLLEEGKAYYCFCTPEELEARREAAQAAGAAPGYDGRCRALSPAERERLRAEGRTPVVRLRTEAAGEIIVEDLIRGRVRFNQAVLDDFIIMKSDGMATYNFAVVIDDALMGITHVIRGEDHLSNTPKQILLYQALDFPLPQFAHIPMILGPDRTRLSKRHGATSVTQYRDDGYLPEAMVNYLALLGWSYNATQTLFSREELVEKFSLKKVSKNPAVFDPAKLLWMNGQYLRALTPEAFVAAARPFLERAGLAGSGKPEWLAAVLGAVQTRVQTLAQVPEMVAYFFQEPVYEPEAVAKHWQGEATAALLMELAERLEKLAPFDATGVEAVFQNMAAEKGRKLGEIIHPTRVALTGRAVSPGIYEVVLLLGQETTCRRLRAASEAALRF